MKYLLLLILSVIFYRIARSSISTNSKKIKKTKDGKQIQFQDAEYKEID